MKAIEKSFNEEFSHWEIRLPAEAVRNRQRGKILERGWTIWYLFGSDEKGEYLDYYSHNRFTDDRHVRIYEDGSHHGLDTIQYWLIHSQEDSEDVISKREEEFKARNRKVAQMLEEKGFGITGNETGSAMVKRWFACGEWLPNDSDDKD